MNRFTRYRKFLKYTILGNLPGHRGRQYRRRLVRLRIETLSRGKICIDLGANSGAYTRKMALAAKRVIAFEPDPWTFDRLRKNVSHLGNVAVVNAAAGISDGSILLFRHREFAEDPEARSESSSVVACGDYLNTEEGIEVRQVNFIRYLEELRENIGVLKIDIEGAEIELLEALFDRPELLDRIDYIFAETHEEAMPGLTVRARAIRERAARIVHPKIDLERP